ncbi:hypothetical protein ACGGZK_07845 [Agromyces sp. MMS24-K17]|uniref:hypothetical protein n=1 Tax=Agromyces sp. MMS24-K17 TaxID=3372850 RepID=UPI003754B59B
MDGFTTRELQVRLGVEVEHEDLLLDHVTVGGDPKAGTDEAIIWCLTSVLDSHAFRDLLTEYGLAVRRGEVRSFSPHVTTILPGTGLDHPATESAEPFVY